MKSNRQIMLSIIGIAVLIIGIVGITYAFFNYTRTGSSNVIKVGRIYFNTEQNSSINLTNVFPIDSSDIDNGTDYVGTVTIHVTGDTTYSEGIEYLVTAEDLNNAVGEKKMPISLDVSYNATDNKTIGENDSSYYINRGGNTSRYKLLKDRLISDDNGKILVGYIAPNQTGIDGTITIKAFIDKDKIAITDTYPEGLKRIVNPNMTTGEYNDCVAYFNNKYYFRNDENAEDFCLGTGTYNDRTFQEMLDQNSIYGNMLNYVLGHNFVIELGYNGTTSEWVDGRTIFTTEEWNSLQKDGISFKVKVEANEGIWAGEPGNAMNQFPDSSALGRNDYLNVKELYFVKMNETEMNNRYNQATKKADITYNDEGKVLMWLEDNTEESGKYNMYVVSEGETILTTADASFLYAKGLTNIEKIEFGNLNTSRITSMNCLFQFQEKLKTLDLRGLDTSNVIDMHGMIYRTNIENVYMDGLDMRKVKDMSSMFYGNWYLNDIDLSNVKVRDLEETSTMFYQSRIDNLNLEGFGGDNLTSVDSMFHGLAEFKTINMKNFNFGKVTSLDSLFSDLGELESIDLSGAKMSKVETMTYLFENCSSLTNVNMSNINSSSLRGIDNLFRNCTSLANVNFSGMNLESITTMYGMFYGCSSIVSLDFSNFTSDSLTNISEIFTNCSSLRSINFSNFNFGTSSLYYLFHELSNLEEVDLSNANTSNVTDMSYMFYYCGSLTDVDFSNVNTSNVTNMYGMFYECDSLVNLDLRSLSISQNSSTGYMFSGCDNLKTIDLSGFGTLAGDTFRMFSNCPVLTTIYISLSWNIPIQQYSSDVFYNCNALVGGNGTHFDSTKVGPEMAVIDNDQHEGYLTLRTSGG